MLRRFLTPNGGSGRKSSFAGANLLKPLETGIDLVFLGTSSAKATFSRNTSCIALHYGTFD